MSTASSFSVKSIQDVTVVGLTDSMVADTQVILQSTEKLKELIGSKSEQKLILDLADVKFLSSAALGMLVTLRKHVQAVQGQLVICAANADLQKLFSITSLDQLFTIYENKDSALEVLGATSAEQ